jgi:hypothetical protein
MASARCTANVAAQVLLNVPLHMKAIIDDVEIDNQGASGSITVQLQDVFTQDISQTNNAPAVQTAYPFQTTVTQNTSVSADELTVGEIDCLGTIAVICSATDVGCVVIVTWHLE